MGLSTQSPNFGDREWSQADLLSQVPQVRLHVEIVIHVDMYVSLIIFLVALCTSGTKSCYECGVDIRHIPGEYCTSGARGRGKKVVTAASRSSR